MVTATCWHGMRALAQLLSAARYSARFTTSKINICPRVLWDRFIYNFNGVELTSRREFVNCSHNILQNEPNLWDDYWIMLFNKTEQPQLWTDMEKTDRRVKLKVFIFKREGNKNVRIRPAHFIQPCIARKAAIHPVQ